MKCSFPQVMSSGKSVGGPAILYLRRSSWRIWPFSSEYVGDKKKTDPILFFFLHPTSCIPWIELHRDLTNAGEDTLLVWEINLSAAFRKKAHNRWSLTHEEGGFWVFSKSWKTEQGRSADTQWSIIHRNWTGWHRKGGTKFGKSITATR